MARFLVVASVNADRVWRLAEKLRPGGRHLSTGTAIQIGGAGWYAANAIRGSGHDAVLACTLGEDALGRALFDRVRQTGIDMSAIECVPAIQPLDILLDPDGERTLIFSGTSAKRPMPGLPTRRDFDGIYVNTRSAISAMHCAKDGAPVVVQMPLRDRDGRYPGTHVVVSRSDVSESPRALWERARETTDGRVEGLIITDGPDPIAIVTKDGEVTVPAGPAAPPGRMTIGAGDTFAAHLLTSLGTGRTLIAAAAEAAQAASRWLADRTEPPTIEA